MSVSRRLRAAGTALAIALAAWALAAAWIVIDGLRDRNIPAELVVVPGSNVLRDGSPSARLRARLDRAYDLWLTRTPQVILVSGGVGRSGWDEARVMGDDLAGRGVPRERIVEDSLGFDTWQTALHARALMRERNLHGVVVVSQAYHLPRCRLAFARLGIAPVGTVHAHFAEPRDAYSALREALGMVKYALGPAPR